MARTAVMTKSTLAVAPKQKQILPVINRIAWLTILLGPPWQTLQKKCPTVRLLQRLLSFPKQKNDFIQSVWATRAWRFRKLYSVACRMEPQVGRNGSWTKQNLSSISKLRASPSTTTFRYLITTVIYRYDAGINTFDTANVSTASENPGSSYIFDRHTPMVFLRSSLAKQLKS